MAPFSISNRPPAPPPASVQSTAKSNAVPEQASASQKPAAAATGFSATDKYEGKVADQYNAGTTEGGRKGGSNTGEFGDNAAKVGQVVISDDLFS